MLLRIIPFSRPLLSAALATAVLNLVTAGSASARAPIPATLIEQRAITMQGLSIGLGLLTLSSQFTAVVATLAYPPGACLPLLPKGGVRLVKSVKKGRVYSGRVDFFFDASCSSRSMIETLRLESRASKYILDADITIFSPAGRKVATLELSGNTLTSTGSDDRLFGPAVLKPVGKAPAVHLALSCELPLAVAAGLRAPPSAGGALARASDFDCEGASAQDFPLVRKSIAAQTLVTLRLNNKNQVTFRQAVPGRLVVGAPGALSVNVTAAGKLRIVGKSQPWSRNALTGRTSGLVVFPEKPTTWGITDAGKRAKFHIGLRNEARGNYAGAVSRMNGEVLAPFRLDASGSGVITYSDGVKATISSWILTR